MGKISNSINHYLSDNRRFADLFNGTRYQISAYGCRYLGDNVCYVGNAFHLGGAEKIRGEKQ